MTTEGISAKQAARELGIEARILRKFLRSDASPFEAVGQGQRYVFDSEDMKVLKKAFADAHPKKAVRKVHYHEPDDAEDVDHTQVELRMMADLARPTHQDELDLDELDEPSEDELELMENFTLDDVYEEDVE